MFLYLSYCTPDPSISPVAPTFQTDSKSATSSHLQGDPPFAWTTRITSTFMLSLSHSDHNELFFLKKKTFLLVDSDSHLQNLYIPLLCVRPGVLRFMGSQRVGHDWATGLVWCVLWEVHVSMYYEKYMCICVHCWATRSQMYSTSNLYLGNYLCLEFSSPSSCIAGPSNHWCCCWPVTSLESLFLPYYLHNIRCCHFPYLHSVLISL